MDFESTLSHRMILKMGADPALLQRMYGFNPEVEPPTQEDTL
jgi:hypothetical protein